MTDDAVVDDQPDEAAPGEAAPGEAAPREAAPRESAPREAAPDEATPDGDAFRVEFVPGVTPDKWRRTWLQRLPDVALDLAPVEQVEAVSHLRDGSASMALVRLPVDRDGLHVIPLYEEVPVVVVAKEHVVAAFEEVDVADLAGEVLVQDPGAVPEWTAVATAEARERSTAMPAMTVKQAVSVVASGSGIVVVPMSVARLHHRKDVVHRPVTGVAPSRVGLAWRVDDDDPRLEEFIGIVRGRTERSSRGAAAGADGDARAGGRHTESKKQDAKKQDARKQGAKQDRGRALPQRGGAPRRRAGSGGSGAGGKGGSRRKGRR
ncbi:LysR substrate-binding domain-containing protein [Terrabacter sp. NPDC000476]|uniref:LysR substrate-binding domain-containing protein n=1 Tax=Terrabacter sp. NPDC000476 TaxID=3154258 RepID=UPI00331FDF75